MIKAAKLRKLQRDARGVAAIEFAIIAPILLLMLCGIFVYGLYFATLHGLQQIVAEASRASIAGLTDVEREQLAKAQINGTISNYGLLDRQYLQVRAATDPTASDRYIITVTYDATHLGLDAFGAILPQPPNHITRSSVIRKGGA
ncbi:TadE/TadG family type IV pilus assembly protein [Terrarubrum flagellatum]|uniref:TadE/TadG family type IV pilus assembly protein n=1 Tax=Terrirubrum flagellatum TaxID=2895980 RepID=UPI0031456B9B